jgi:hypothetical protein
MWLLSAILLFLAFGGIGGGVLLLEDPTGAALGLDAAWLANTPFSSYLIPGFILLLLFGLGSLAVLYALWEMPKVEVLARLTGFTHEHWAWDMTVLLGVILLGWLLYQFAFLPVQGAIQSIMLVVALALILLPMLPAMRRFYAR